MDEKILTNIEVGLLGLDDVKIITQEMINGYVKIDDNAFYECHKLESIDIPNSITYIGDWAFAKCSNLTSVNIPDTITSIGDYVFYDCSKLTSINIPRNVTSIGQFAFYYCNSLKSIDIPEGVTNIGQQAFAWCSSLISITIPDSVTSVEEFNFYGCDNLSVDNGIMYAGTYLVGVKDKTLSTYNIKPGTRWIGSFAFSECYNLTDIIIPNTVISIERSAFEYCNNLKSISIPEGVTNIKSYAFSNCSNLSTVSIPASITSINHNAFYGCYKLSSVKISDISSWCKLSFSGYSNPLYYAHNLYLNDTLVTNLVIPDDVINIGDGVFCGCNSLTSVTINDNITYIGNIAFAYCNNITSIVIPNNVTYIGNSAFHNCANLTSITIPNNIKYIGMSIFLGCNKLNHITIGDKLYEPQHITDNTCKAYKGLKGNMTCMDFKYKIGKTHEMAAKPKICEYGFHACLNLRDVFNYYYGWIGKDIVVCEVTLDGIIDTSSSDSKSVCNKITINKRIL